MVGEGYLRLDGESAKPVGEQDATRENPPKSPNSSSSDPASPSPSSSRGGGEEECKGMMSDSMGSPSRT